MFQLMFRRPWLLVLWAAGILFSASTFVGEGGGAEQIARSAERARAERTALEHPSSPVPHILEAEPPAPLLLPGDDPKADPNNPRVGDVFVDPSTGQRVLIVEVGRPADSATPTSE